MKYNTMNDDLFSKVVVNNHLFDLIDNGWDGAGGLYEDRCNEAVDQTYSLTSLINLDPGTNLITADRRKGVYIGSSKDFHYVALFGDPLMHYYNSDCTDTDGNADNNIVEAIY